MGESRRNWAGNQDYGAARIHYPESVAEVRRIVADAAKVRPLGARHSFSAIAATPGDLLSLDRLDRVLDIDTERRTATVEAGIRYAALGSALDRAGLALPNLASLPHISVAGACATATHGSGDGNGSLATAVAALELVTADGDVLTLSRARDGDRFPGAVVGLGGLGVVTMLTLDLVPTFAMAQVVYEDLPLATLLADFEAIMSSAYSVSLFTDWRGDRINQVWVKRRVTDEGLPATPAEFFGACPATEERRPSGGPSAGKCTAQLGVPGPWYERLPHFRPDALPSIGAELQSEYFVPRAHAVAALRAVAALGDRLAPALVISEVRTIAADDLWLSPCHGRDSVGLHFTWRADWPAVAALLPLLEARLAPFDARPHWGKLFATTPDRLGDLYPRLPDFRALLHDHDPAGEFRNAFLDRHLFGAA